MTNLDLQELARKIHINASRKGFYDGQKEAGFESNQLYEIAKEVAEMHEAYKKNRFANSNEFVSKEDFELNIKDTFEDEMADIVIRCLDYMYWKKFTIYSPAKFEVNFTLLNESFYYITTLCIEMTKNALSGAAIIYEVYCMIFSIAYEMEIDVDKHIIAKMEYNKQRERLHGKAF